MTYFLFHTNGDPNAAQLGILDEEHDDRWKQNICFNYQLRSIDTNNSQFPFFELWNVSRFAVGDPVNGANCTIGADNTSSSGTFEPSTIFNGGAWRPAFLNGQCTTSSGTPLAGAVVVLALTATDQYVSSGVTDQNGNYSLPTNFSGQQHYIYANYSNGLYVGGSVNTLTPNG